MLSPRHKPAYGGYTITSSTWALEPGIIQAHLLLQAHAILCACGSETRHGIHLLTRSVEVRTLRSVHMLTYSSQETAGLMEPLPVQPQATDLDTLWRQFVRAESHKRTAYGTYQCDAMWYQTFSRPRLVSHLEIKHDLPCPVEQWQARTPEEWAHASLLRPSRPIRYIDAIRATLKPESTAELAALGLPDCSASCCSSSRVCGKFPVGQPCQGVFVRIASR